jgi:hypothetical protein
MPQNSDWLFSWQNRLLSAAAFVNRGRLVFLCEKKIRGGGKVFARIKKNKARKVAKPPSLPRRIGMDHYFFASLRLPAADLS